jgi:hypothetical protein
LANNQEFPAGKTFKDYQWIDMTDGKFFTFTIFIEHFIVWMRTAGLPNFRKLWGRIENKLLKGRYTVLIENNYEVNTFQGNKYFVLSTTNALGGKNYFLAVCYIVVGSLCLIFAVIFLIAYLKKKQTRREE